MFYSIHISSDRMWQIELLNPLVKKINPKDQDNTKIMLGSFFTFIKNDLDMDYISTICISQGIINVLYTLYKDADGIPMEELGHRVLGLVLYFTRHSDQTSGDSLILEFIDRSSFLKKSLNYPGLLLSDYLEKPSHNPKSSSRFFDAYFLKKTAYQRMVEHSFNQCIELLFKQLKVNEQDRQQTIKKLISPEDIIQLIKDIRPEKETLINLLADLYEAQVLSEPKNPIFEAYLDQIKSLFLSTDSIFTSSSEGHDTTLSPAPL